jgi:hypothetical protein
MLKSDMIRRNPLRMMGYEEEDILPKGGFGGLLARAGVGKTAFLVQIGMDKLLRNKTVLHVTIDEPVDKVCLWYEEVLRTLAKQCNVGKVDAFWDEVLPNRFIMSFRVGGFTVSRLDERVSELTEQGIFFPQLILIDGLPFDQMERSDIEALKAMAAAHSAAIWFSIRTHRHEAPGPDGMPKHFSGVADLFDVALELIPNGKDVCIGALKGGPPMAVPERLILDPSTMMIKTADAGLSAGKP